MVLPNDRESRASKDTPSSISIRANGNKAKGATEELAG